MYLKVDKELAVLNLYTNNYNKQLYLREISKLTKIPLKTIQNTLQNLENENTLKSMVRGKNKYFRLNKDTIQTKFCLLQAEIYKTLLFIQKYPLFKLFLKEIKSNNTLIVFGSFAKFKAHKDSDLDLLIISRDGEKIPSHLIPNKIHNIELTESSFIKSLENQETLIKEIEDNHIILNNHSFYVNIIWNYYGK